MRHVKTACTALADRKWAWIVAEVDAGVDNDVLRQIEMLENSRDGLKAIRTHGTLKYCRVGIKSHLSIPKNCNLRKFVSLSQKLREWNTWLFESATRNRVHVETASIITPKPPVTLPMGGI